MHVFVRMLKSLECESILALIQDCMNSQITSATSAADDAEALEIIASQGPDIVLLDCQVPMSLDICQAAVKNKKNRETRVIIIFDNCFYDLLFAFRKSGASGFLTKACARNELCECIMAVCRGEMWVSANVEKAFDAGPGVYMDINNDYEKPLTSRELEVLKCLANGMSSPQTADKMGITVRTVDVHKTNTYRKLKLRNISQLVHYAIRHKLVDP